jgi:hypothetical protein
MSQWTIGIITYYDIISDSCDLTLLGELFRRLCKNI